MSVGSVIVLLIIVSVDSFNVEIINPVVTVLRGDSVKLYCKADYDYEYCKFVSPRGEECLFEWKRKAWNITRQQCQVLTSDWSIQ